MPVYEYYCHDCEDVFTHYKSIIDYKKPTTCPDCGELAERAICSAPNLNTMKAETRKAYQTNEKSAHEPRVSNGHGHTCGPSCNHGHTHKHEKKTDQQTPALKQQNGRRPWMLGH